MFQQANDWFWLCEKRLEPISCMHAVAKLVALLAE
jgi:hypothetical protein